MTTERRISSETILIVAAIIAFVLFVTFKGDYFGIGDNYVWYCKYNFWGLNKTFYELKNVDFGRWVGYEEGGDGTIEFIQDDRPVFDDY